MVYSINLIWGLAQLVFLMLLRHVYVIGSNWLDERRAICGLLVIVYTCVSFLILLQQVGVNVFCWMLDSFVNRLGFCIKNGQRRLFSTFE